MGVLFNNIPGNIRVPFFYAEFQAGGTPYQNNSRLLLIGQKLTAGRATANAPVMVRDGSEDSLFGIGSMLAQMYKTARANAPLQEIWALPLADDDAGVAATGKITVANAPVTQAGAMSLYISGTRVRIAVLTTDTNAIVAANLMAAINAVTSLPVVASIDPGHTAEVILTARHKGALGNTVQIDLGTVLDDGVLGRALLTITALASGAGDPDMSAGFANLGDDEFDWIGSAYGDSNAVGDASNLTNDTSGRWSWIKQIYGHYIGPSVATVGGLASFGAGLNDQHSTIFPCRKFRSDKWNVVAAVAAQCAVHLSEPPELSRPMQTIKLQGIQGPLDAADRLTKTDRQTLYYSGISGYYVGRDGSVYIDRLITTYQTNALGDRDATYLDIETMAQSQYGIRYIRQVITNAHGRKALADSNPAGLPQIVTPQDLRATAIHAYTDLVALGVFEGVDTFARDLIVERNAVDHNRCDFSLPLDHVNQLRIAAVAAVNYMQRRTPGDGIVNSVTR